MESDDPSQKQQTALEFYANDALAFVKDCIEFPNGKELAPYQEEILGGFVRNKKVAVRGPHGLGKTALASWIILWGVLTADDVKVPVTASAWRQLTKFLFPEVHKWARRLRWDKLGREPFTKYELQTLSLKISPTQEAFAVASDTPELIEGAHAERIVYVFDEAKAIPEATWDAAEGAFSTGDCYALAISTPGQRSGRFYDIHRRMRGLESWKVRHVTLDEAISAGRISREWADERKEQWGEESPIYQARVLGEFPEQSENSLISLAWIEAARERELEPKGEPVLGVDVARFGDDDSGYLEWQEPCVMGGEVWHGHDTMKTAGRIAATSKHANVDVIGVGAGVYDRLNEDGCPCTPINVSEKPNDEEHFVNVRAEEFWNLRIRFQNGLIDLSRLSRELYDRLSGELTAIIYEFASNGKIKIEEKAKMKERTGHSPDVADMLMLSQRPFGQLASAVVENVEYSIEG